MKRAHILMLAAAAGAAYLIYRGGLAKAPVAANPGTVAVPAKGDAPAAAQQQAVNGSESTYTTPKLDPGGLMNQLGQLFQNGQYGT